jgi:hypothetical protein
MPRKHVIMCQRRFVSKIEANTKLHTIRPERKRPIRPGDLLDLRYWSGKPYRSKQKKIKVVTCVGYAQIDISVRLHHVWLLTRSHYYGSRVRRLNADQVLTLAQRDGFTFTHELFQFFRDNHGGILIGRLIEWTS